MSADGELYVNEDCRDAFEKELNKAFGKHKWHLSGSKFSDHWDMGSFPKKITVDVMGDVCNDEKIGVATIISKPYIEENAFGERRVEMDPQKITIKKMKK